jgi:hypothetical protein
MSKSTQILKFRANKRVEAQEHRAIDLALTEREKHDLEFDQRSRLIQDMLEKAGITFSDSKHLKFVNAEAWNGIQQAQRKLVYNPHAMNDDLRQPWAGKSSVWAWKNYLSRIPAPTWALRLKQSAVESMTRPNTVGMLRRDGKTPNKDLEQLLTKVNKFKKGWDGKMHSAYKIAMQRLVKKFLDFNGGEKVRLRLWSHVEFEEAMKNAINSSSPGYPLNGYDWKDDLGDRSVFMEVYRLGCDAIINRKTDGHIYVAGARYTGDGGDASPTDDGEGRQRHFRQAPADEKLASHIIASPLKPFIKADPLSGQLGIQCVSANAKQLAQGHDQCSLYDKPVAVGDWDVSRWDTAQTRKFIKEGFFAFLREVYDMDHTLTKAILDGYEERFMKSQCLMHWGMADLDFLPSGSGITTVVAFIHHWLICFTLDELFKRQAGFPLLCEVGLQGDDFLAFLSDQGPHVTALVKEVYAAFGCTIKGDLAFSSLSDPDCTAVFLSEAIHLLDDQPNFRFPKWNFLMAESERDLSSMMALDRMLYAEIRERCPHASQVELKIASFFSKMDRFKDLPFFEGLMKRCLNLNDFRSLPLRSWVGVRVMEKSPSRLWLLDYEELMGIETPDAVQQILDRQEESWLLGDALGQVAALFALGTYDPSTRGEIRHVINTAKRNNKQFRSSLKLLRTVDNHLTELDDTQKTDYKKLVDVVNKGFEKGFADKARQMYEENLVKQEKRELASKVLRSFEDDPDVQEVGPIAPRQIARAVLTLNATNPFELLKKTAKVGIMLYNSSSWANLTTSQQDACRQAYRSLFFVELDDAASLSEAELLQKARTNLAQ